jgi:hypothetical protein
MRSLPVSGITSALPACSDRREIATPQPAERLVMPDVPPLHVYPRLWTESRLKYPHDHQWPQQLQLLCELAQ